MNLLQHAQRRFRSGREEAVSILRRATVVASDETGVRIKGSNAYHWVFQSADAAVHAASPTRGAVGGAGDDERPPACGVDFESLNRPAASCRRTPDLSRPSRP